MAPPPACDTKCPREDADNKMPQHSRETHKATPAARTHHRNGTPVTRSRERQGGSSGDHLSRRTTAITKVARIRDHRWRIMCMKTQSWPQRAACIDKLKCCNDALKSKHGATLNGGALPSVLIFGKATNAKAQVRCVSKQV